MPHTEHILPGGRYSVVSCHVERPLDDDVWNRFVDFRRRHHGGFRIAALMRTPDAEAGEDEAVWLERAHQAAELGPLGLHTHWTAPDHARPTGGDPAGRVREQAEWLAARDLPVSLFCGGGWYLDEAVAETLAELGYADCTATAFRPGYLAADAPRLGSAEPCYVELASGRRLLELPTTHSIGMLARGLLGPFRGPLVHAYFHDTDLLDRVRREALRVGLGFLGAKRLQTDLAALQRGLRPEKTMSFANKPR
ncbi:MAG TPA: hypothetical protein VEH52_13565 [Gaiellaceae bacterium]|nr:hypothetical protein [Gaiellaceae bacterium]